MLQFFASCRLLRVILCSVVAFFTFQSYCASCRMVPSHSSVINLPSSFAVWVCRVFHFLVWHNSNDIPASWYPLPSCCSLLLSFAKRQRVQVDWIRSNFHSQADRSSSFSSRILTGHISPKEHHTTASYTVDRHVWKQRSDARLDLTTLIDLRHPFFPLIDTKYTSRRL